MAGFTKNESDRNIKNDNLRNNNEPEKKLESNQKVKLESGRIVRFLTDNDMIVLGNICYRNVEQIQRMETYHKGLINSIVKKNHNMYNQFIWKLSGPIDTISMLRGYNRLLKEEDILRTNYIIDKLSADVMITYEHALVSFPIIDISDLSPNDKIMKIVNSSASEARQRYNPENSPVLRLRAFIIGKEELVILVSYIGSICNKISKVQIMDYIFPRMRVNNKELESFGQSASRVNEAIKEDNLNYWKAKTDDYGKELIIPGELKLIEKIGKKRIMETAHKTISDDLFDKLTSFSNQYGVCKGTVLLYAWANLLGGYNGEERPAMAIVGNRNELMYYPVFASIKESCSDAIKSLEEDWSNSIKHGYIDDKDFGKIINDDFGGHFHLQHHFMDFENLDSNVENFMPESAGCKDIGITIKYNVFQNKINMNYAYYNDLFFDDGIDQLHNFFIDSLTSIVSQTSHKFDKNKFIEENDTAEEKKEKLDIAQRAIYIKNCNIFSVCSPDDFMRLSERSFHQRCAIDDTIIAESSVGDYLCIVAEGKLEESIMDHSGMVNSLRILSKSDVFSIESILSNRIVKNSYTVVSDEATIVYIPKDDIINLMDTKPELYRRLIESEHRRIYGLQRSWILQ